MNGLSPTRKMWLLWKGGREDCREVAVSGGLTAISLRMLESKIADSRKKE